jgi:hypothetical protein
MRAPLTTLISLSIFSAALASCSASSEDDTAAVDSASEDGTGTAAASTPDTGSPAATASDKPASTSSPSSSATPNAGGSSTATLPGNTSPEDDTATSEPVEGDETDGANAEPSDAEMPAAGESDSEEGASDAQSEADETEAEDTASADTETGENTVSPELSALDPFSFFVTSLAALQDLSGSENGFGGDLRYGEADGLSGADKLCGEIAERSMPGSSAKEWHAFLSTTAGGVDDGPIHAIDRVGEGPWYDRLGRVIALDKESLVNQRPEGIDPEIELDLPNEDGVPNHAPDGELVDNHDMLTGTNDQGQLYTEDGDALAATCNDWTSAEPSGAPRVGHPWPTGAGRDTGTDTGTRPAGGGGFGGGGGGGFGDMANWMSALTEAGCAPGVSLVEMGGPKADDPSVGSGGGYGGFYCFAMNP